MIVTVTLNAALAVSYEATTVSFDKPGELTRARYRASGRGVTAARVLHKFGHDVLATGLVGGTAGELIAADLARAGVEADFTRIGRESRRTFGINERETGRTLRLREPGPYVTTEELGRFAADFRRLLEGATAVVLCGTLPAGLPPEIYGSLVSYAASAGVPAIVDADGEELMHGALRRPDLVIHGAVGPAPNGPAAEAVAEHRAVRVRAGAEGWTARLATDPGPDPDPGPMSRGALVAGLVPGLLLGWSWPDRLRHAVSLALSADPAGDVNLEKYEEILSGDVIRVAEVGTNTH